MDRSLTDAFRHFARNEKWGTCADCPRNDEGAYPEFCKYTNRLDHQLDLDELTRIYKLRKGAK